MTLLAVIGLTCLGLAVVLGLLGLTASLSRSRNEDFGRSDDDETEGER